MGRPKGRGAARRRETAEEREMFRKLGMGDEEGDLADGEDLDADPAAPRDARTEVDALVKERQAMRKRKRKDIDPHELKMLAEEFLARMEVAAEQDLQCLQDDQPAVHKLNMLPDVERVLKKKQLHHDLLDAGLFGVVKAWMEPIRARLPNVRIRETLLQCLLAMDVQLGDEDRRDSLKRSGLGKSVNFYSKLDLESEGNRRLAAQLVQKWSSQVFRIYKPEMDAETHLPPAAETVAPRRSGKAPRITEAEDILSGKADLKPGDPGFRWHATVPQKASMDYKYRPASNAVHPTAKSIEFQEKEERLSRRMRGMGKSSEKFERPVNLSVEGRGM